MLASGKFEVNLEPQTEDRFDSGRLLIEKHYMGELVGIGRGQMLSKRTDSGVAIYSALEEVSGTIDIKTGCFTLYHRGYMSSSKQDLDIVIVEGSGTGDFEGISGELKIEQKDGNHFFELSYHIE